MKLTSYLQGIGIILLFTFFSCSYQGKKILFKTEKEIVTDDENPVIVSNPQAYPNEHICKEGDVLIVRLLNENGEQETYDKLAASRDDAKFVVRDSIVTLPSIGDIKVVGLNKNEIVKKVRKEYAKFIIDPIVDVDFYGLSVNVLGEVVKPGKYVIDENMTVIDGLGLAGGFSPYGIFTNVKIIRGKGDKQEVIVVDVTNIEALDHPKLLLKDEDIVYVEPRRVKQFDTAVRPYLFLTSILSSAAAVFIVISRTR
ncbi:MAG: polysaccharide biosynthesis/export family protein [Vicingaceae bacterium]